MQLKLKYRNQPSVLFGNLSPDERILANLENREEADKLKAHEHWLKQQERR